jgi:hypothetical protein
MALFFCPVQSMPVNTYIYAYDSFLYFCTVVKGFVTILILLFSVFIANEGWAYSLQSMATAKPVNKPIKEEVVTTGSKEKTACIYHKASLTIPASRCGHVLKDLGSSSSIEQDFPVVYYNRQPNNNLLLLAKSSYLLHIYPFHNFW